MKILERRLSKELLVMKSTKQMKSERLEFLRFELKHLLNVITN